MEINKIEYFNSLFSTNEINILKILTFYLTGDAKNIAIAFIFLQEFLLLRTHPSFPANKQKSKDIHYFFEEIDPYLHSDETKHLQRLKEALQQMESMQEMIQVLQEMQKNQEPSSESEEDTEDFINTFFSSL